MLPGVVGLLMSTEAIKFIVGIGKVMKNRLILYDALDMSIRTLQMAKNKKCVLCGDNPSLRGFMDYESFVNASQADTAEKKTEETPVPTATVRELQQSMGKGNVILVDVREPHEWDMVRIKGARLAPVGDLPNGLDLLPKEEKIFVYCHHGIRSETAVRIMQEQGFLNAVSVEGGIDSWAKEIDPSLPRY